MEAENLQKIRSLSLIKILLVLIEKCMFVGAYSFLANRKVRSLAIFYKMVSKLLDFEVLKSIILAISNIPSVVLIQHERCTENQQKAYIYVYL